MLILLDLYDATNLAVKAISTMSCLPKTHISALEAYVQTLVPSTATPHMAFHSSVLSIHSTIIAMLLALSRPTSLISSITTSRKSIERSYNSLSRSTRWPLGLLDETRQRLNEEKEDKVRKTKDEVDELSRELRYTQQVVASELAGWQDMHEKMGRKAIRELARSMLIKERTTLEGMQRAIRKLRKGTKKTPLAYNSGEVNGRSVANGSGESS